MFIEHEIDMLIARWRAHGVDEQTIELLSQDIRQQCDVFVQDTVQNAYAQALYLGFEGDCEEFLDQLTISQNGTDFEITTLSGRTDFSVAPYSMLPGLLRNAKIAKDGSRYKTIPMRAKGKSTVDTMRNINADKWEMKNELRRKKEARRLEKNAAPIEGFRTASSKQNPATSWKHPGFDKDFTTQLQTINIELNTDLVLGIRKILTQYEESLWRL